MLRFVLCYSNHHYFYILHLYLQLCDVFIKSIFYFTVIASSHCVFHIPCWAALLPDGQFIAQCDLTRWPLLTCIFVLLFVCCLFICSLLQYMFCICRAVIVFIPCKSEHLLQKHTVLYVYPFIPQIKANRTSLEPLYWLRFMMLNLTINWGLFKVFLCNCVFW